MKAAITLILAASTLISAAADRIPKEMRPKLVKEGKVLVQDDFSTEKLHEGWLMPKGDFAGKVTRQPDGTVQIETGVGRQGYIYRKLDPGTQDASVQLLIKPQTSTWMGVRFTVAGEDGVGDRHWKIATIAYASGFIRVVEPDAAADVNKLKVLKSAKTDIKPGEWWRISVESREDKYLVRVNGEEMIELKHPGTAGEKVAVMVNLYGGTGLIDEVKVMAGGK
ncbi:MAG: hypothetical protein IPK32_23355 [Verrucomicrobiaceae bacterium]|nr:hypothetical protein [Verrucomicrobiaceae bacterium]